MNTKVKDQFNMLSTDYDSRRSLLIPCFDNLYVSGIEMLAYADAAPRVLDVGAGTGIYAEALLARYPKAMLTLIDFAENMLELAKEKFYSRADVKYILDDYFTHDYRDAAFDIVISALSIHHLDDSDKQKFYANLYSILDDGGELLNADIISTGAPEIDARYDEIWTSFVAGNIGEGEYFERFKASKKVDNPSSYSEQLKWLRDAGFKQTDCVFKHNNFAVLYARK